MLSSSWAMEISGEDQSDESKWRTPVSEMYGEVPKLLGSKGMLVVGGESKGPPDSESSDVVCVDMCPVEEGG